MNELEIFRYWVAYYAHFTSDKYDFIEYGGKINASAEALLKRPEYKLYKASKTKFKDVREFLQILLAGIDQKRIGVPLHISEALEIHSFDETGIVKNWLKKTYDLHSTIGEDLDKIIQLGFNKNRLFLPNGSEIPRLLSLWENRIISTECLYVLDLKYNIFKLWDAKIYPNLIWKHQKTFINKYMRFINISDKNFDSDIEFFIKRLDRIS